MRSQVSEKPQAPPASPRRPRSRAGWAGVGFVIAALASSTLISLPLSADPPERIAALYAAHRTAYVAAQLVGVLGVALFVWFLIGLRARRETSDHGVLWSGVLVSAAALSTNVAVLVLSLNDQLSPAGIYHAALATDITDDILFATYGLLAVALAVSGLPRWLRIASGVSGVLCLTRALLGGLAPAGLEASAAIAILTLLLILSVRMARRPSAARLGGKDSPVLLEPAPSTAGDPR